MKELIYYPTFEIYDENWLKFSLLYFESIKPIIPHANKKDLSDTFYFIEESTNFYNPLHPDQSMDSIVASNDAVEVVEKIIQNPYDYIDVFKNVNIKREWENPENWCFELCRGKYTKQWIDLIENAKIGKVDSDSIKMDIRLGNLYMTIFAHVLSDLYSIPIITNKHEIHKFSMLTRNRMALGEQNREIQKINFTERVIEIQIPDGLESIPLNEIISLRNDDEFKTNMKAYHISIAEMQTHSKNESPKEFIEKYNYTFNKYVDGIISAGFKVAKFGLKYFNPENISNDLEDLFEATKTGYDSYSTLSKTWNKTEIKRHTRKYLMELKELN